MTLGELTTHPNRGTTAGQQSGRSTMQVIFSVNGPGEISGWLYPLTNALRARFPQIRIFVCLLPCVFSSGAEASVARQLETVDEVCTVRESFALILRGRLPSGLSRQRPTLVFHLGGEVALTLLIAARLRAPVYGYADGRLPAMRRFRKVFFSGLTPLPAGLSDRAELLVGELMVDAATLRRAGVTRPTDGRPRIGLFPGSREYMADFLLPYYAVTVDAVTARHPDVDWLLARADFVRMDFLRQLAPPPEPRQWPATTLRFGEAGNDAWLETPAGTRIRILPGREVLALADLALTIPGTNTGEIAAGGTPMVVVLPTYRGDEVPLPGVAGHLGRLPLVGKALKLAFGYRLLKSLPLLAQPNRRAGRMIVPELVGTDLHPRILAEIEKVLTTDTTALRETIKGAMGRPGAADRITDEIGAFFGL